MCRRRSARAPGEAGGGHATGSAVGVSSGASTRATGKSRFHTGLTGLSRRLRSPLSGLLLCQHGHEAVLPFLKTFWKLPSWTRSSTTLCSMCSGDTPLRSPRTTSPPVPSDRIPSLLSARFKHLSKETPCSPRSPVRQLWDTVWAFSSPGWESLRFGEGERRVAFANVARGAPRCCREAGGLGEDEDVVPTGARPPSHSHFLSRCVPARKSPPGKKRAQVARVAVRAILTCSPQSGPESMRTATVTVSSCLVSHAGPLAGDGRLGRPRVLRNTVLVTPLHSADVADAT